LPHDFPDHKLVNYYYLEWTREVVSCGFRGDRVY
jgi:hypothetical protein